MLQNAVFGGAFFWGHKKKHQNPVFLFENEGITCKWTLDALTEKESLNAVQIALVRHGFHSAQQDKDLTLIGHSFGSFQLTWFLRSGLCNRIDKFILLEPVSILLSEPDVALNYVYGRGADSALVGESFPRSIFIRLFLSSEIFIEHYLRRHFAWYNSELWLEDIPNHIDTNIYVAEKDQITDSHKIGIEIKRVNAKRSGEKNFKPIKLRQWNGKGHGSCVVLPSLWKEISHTVRKGKTSLEKVV